MAESAGVACAWWPWYLVDLDEIECLLAVFHNCGVGVSPQVLHLYRTHACAHVCRCVCRHTCRHVACACVDMFADMIVALGVWRFMAPMGPVPWHHGFAP